MVAVKETSLFKRGRNLLLSKRPIAAAQHPAEKDLNDRVAERFFVKRTKRSFDLTTASRNTMTLMIHSLKNASTMIERQMQRRGFAKNPNFFLGPKMPSSPEDRKVFATPRRYVCEGCNARLFSVAAYVGHLRKHKVNIRCEGCRRVFDHVVDKRRHELTCSKKLRLRF